MAHCARQEEAKLQTINMWELLKQHKRSIRELPEVPEKKWSRECRLEAHKGVHGTETHMGLSSSSGHTTGANYTDLQFSMFQKRFIAHQVLSSAICISLEMTSSVSYKGKKPHVSTYLRDQLASSCQTDMFKGETKEISHKNNGLTLTADLSLENVIFWSSAIHHAV